MKTNWNFLILLIVLSSAVFALQGCNIRENGHPSRIEIATHSKNAHESHEQSRLRPTNQVAVVTVWAEAEKIEQTAMFYKEVLGLRPVGSNANQHILDTDGSFLVIMEGQLDQPRNTKRRWPLFALTVPDLEESITKLNDAGVVFPWGVEEFGAPNPSSRYVMFYDPAGNLIEIVEWLLSANLHTWRHTFASYIMMRSGNIRAVQKLLGHKSIKTTEIYSHLSDKHLHLVICMLPGPNLVTVA